MIGRLTLLGAGPGDPELITLKGINALADADVVLFDALVNKELLKYAARSSERIFVGKRKGCYAYQQEQINELIVEHAHKGKHVVRLKGGDSFVFGRGAEEMAYASKYGIEVRVVPGISSSFAVPALENIPLTKRKVAESFWVITGTTRDHKLSADVQLAAQSTATVVILMGMSKLEQIAEIFSKFGKGDTPVAVIQNGSLRSQRMTVGTVDNIADKVRKLEIANPAIIVLGEVVNHRQQIQDIIQDVKVKQLAC